MFVFRPPYSEQRRARGVAGVFDAVNAKTGIGDERLVYVRMSQNAHPVTIDDYLRHDRWAKSGVAIRRMASRERRPVLVLQALADKPLVISMRQGAGPGRSLPADAVGIFVYAAGTGVDVIDNHGLAKLDGRTCAGSHNVGDRVTRRRFPTCGYSHASPPMMRRGRRGITREQVAAARRAMSCDRLNGLIVSTTGPWRLSDASSNLFESFRLFDFRFRRIRSPPQQSSVGCPREAPERVR